MFENSEEKYFKYSNFIIFIVFSSVIFALSSSYFSGNMTLNNILFLTFIPMISAFIGMSLVYYLINNKSLKPIIFNKLVLVAIIGLVPSIIIGIALTYISDVLF